MFRSIKKFLEESSITFRLMAAVTASVVLMVLIQCGLMLRSADKKHEMFIENSLKEADYLAGEADRIAKRNLGLAMLIAEMPDVKAAIASRDREKLYKLVKPLQERLVADGVAKIKIHFHLPPGRSFLRVWKPQKYGDDISSFRKTVVTVLKTGKPVSGIEAGRVGLAIRGVAPILDSKGNVMASIETISDLAGLSSAATENGKLNIIFSIDKVKATAAVDSNRKQIGRYTMLVTPPSSIAGIDIPEDLLDRAFSHGKASLERGGFLITAATIPDYRDEPTGIYVRFINMSLFKKELVANLVSALTVAAFTGLIALITVALVIKTNMRIPLARIIRNLDEISEGRLKRGCEIKGPQQVRLLSRSANNILFSNGHLVNLIKKVSESMKSASSELSHVDSRVGDTAGDVERASQEMVRSFEEAVDVLNGVSVSVQELSSATSEIAQSVNETASATNEAMDKASFTNTVMEELGENSDKIGHIIGVINTIAEQTNLLALNATIEAARAGEAGKGFAVVANEVKELAKQTASATEEIQNMINLFQDGIDKAVVSVREITDSVGNINNLANTIASATEEQTATVAGISETVQASEDNFRMLVTRAQELSASADNLAKTASLVNGISTSIGMMSVQFSSISDIYDLDMKGVNSVCSTLTPRGKMTGAILGHFTWLETLRMDILNDRRPSVELDPSKCLMGRWLSEQDEDNSIFSVELIDEVYRLHEDIHAYAQRIAEMTEQRMDRDARMTLFNKEIQPRLVRIMELLLSRKTAQDLAVNQ